MRLKNIEYADTHTHGVCVWIMPNGDVYGDEDGNILSLYAELQDPIAENKMQKAAVSYAGLEALKGKAVWWPGARKITQSEWEDQQERFEEGKIPDVVDAVRQLEGM